MLEIKNNLDGVQGGSSAIFTGLTIMCSASLGYIFTAKFQDGYLFTGVKGSGYEINFINSLNRMLDEKKSRAISEAQLIAQFLKPK